MDQSHPAIVLPVYKPPGITSYDVVRSLKRKFPRHWKKIGHFGTLDPFAQGLLLIGVNSALRANNFVHEFSPKTYVAVGKLGEKTDTGDDTGKVINKMDISELDKCLEKETIEKVFLELVGDYHQQPPYYSATKHEGRPLYEWAREGVFIDKPKVLRHIYSLKLLEVMDHEIKFEVTVSTGTYIRQLIEDIAVKLGTLGHLNFLERTQIGHITSDRAVPEELWKSEGRETDFWLENGLLIDQMIRLNRLTVIDAKSYQNGIPARINEYKLERVDDASTKTLVWVYNSVQELLGMGVLQDDGTVKPEFNLPTN